MSPTSDVPVSMESILERLDAALLAARQWPRRPRHRRVFRDQLPGPVELTTVRLLRAVENAQREDPTIGEVAVLLGVDPSTASRFVDNAVARGEIERRACNDDGRRTRVTLTGDGRATVAAVGAARRTVLAEVTEGWHARDLTMLAELLERLGDRFDEFEASA